MPKLSRLYTDFPNPITDTFTKLHKYNSTDLFANTSPETTKIADDVANKMKIKEQKLVANTAALMNKKKSKTNRKTKTKRKIKKRKTRTNKRTTRK